MCADEFVSTRPVAPKRSGWLAIGLVLLAQVARTLTDDGIRGREFVYLGFLIVYLLVFGVLLWRSNRRPLAVHTFLAVQAGIVIALLALHPQMDYLTSFLIPVAYLAALYFRGRALRAWVAGLALLCVVPTMVLLGPLPGLALSLVTVAGVIMIPAYVVVSQEIELARERSQALLGELQETNRSLQAYSAQVEELAAIEERNRVARELHDTVSQVIFSIALTSRSAQILMRKDPRRVGEQLARLQDMTAAALADLRSLITQMRDSTEN